MTTSLRRLSPLLLAIVFAAGLATAPPTAQDVRAATPDLTIVSDARYDVQPAQKRVRVTVTLRLANRLKDTATKRFYFDEAFLAVLPGSSGYRLTGGSGTPRVSVSKRSADATVLRLTLGSRLYSGKSATYTLRFDLVDTGGDSTRDLRIGESLASFPVWAYATDDTPGSTVTVVFPAGYETTVEAGEIPAPRKDGTGRTVYRTGRLQTPLTFFAYLVGDRPGAYLERSAEAIVKGATVPLTIRAWADDEGWADRVEALVKRALPELGAEIGLPWPRDDTLVIQEAVSRSTGGYAGLFDPNQGLVEVAYYADDFVVLHEAAHGWFNGGLLADRWANEAFASYYGLAVANALDVPATGNEMTDALRESAVPLNAWGPVGKEVPTVEDYAYAATLLLAQAIAERAGQDGLRAVWLDAADRVGAYQPPPDANAGIGTTAAEPELVAGAPDWRVLLDLLEARTSATYDDLWRTWVAREEDLPLLADRAAARTAYDATLTRAADWDLPRPIRDAMRAWRFEEATALLDHAGEILDARAEIEAAADAAGLVAPATLRDTFEGPDGFDDAQAEAAAELAAIERYDAALDARPTAPDLVLQVGLWGATPEDSLAMAKTSFAAGDLAGAASSADTARSVWLSAEDVGRGRLVSAVALGLAVVVAIVLLLLGIVGRRRRHRTELQYAASMTRSVSRLQARPMTPDEARGWGRRPIATATGPEATAATGLGSDPTQPYATLAATPDGSPDDAAHDHDTGARSG